MLFSFLKRSKVLVGLLSLFVLGSCFSGLNVSAMEEKKPVAFGEQNKDGLKLKEFFDKAPELSSGSIVLRHTTDEHIDSLAKILVSRGSFGSFELEKAKDSLIADLQGIKDNGIAYTIFDMYKEKVLGLVVFRFSDIKGSLVGGNAFISYFLDEDAEARRVDLNVVAALSAALQKFQT